MTVPTGTYQTYTTVGIREDLADVIYDISPVDTPFLSTVPKVTATATLHEWQTDELANADGENAAIEGDDAPQTSATPTVRLTNYTQISTKDARVSGTNRSVDSAGRGDELAYQLLKRGKELKRDMETILLSNQAKSAGNASTPRTLAGVPAWIATNTSHVGTDPAGTGANARGDGTQRAFTEDMLREVVRETWDSGGQPDLLMVGAYNRQVVSRFGTEANVRIAMQKMEDSVLHTSFEVYQSDFGSLKIVPDRFQRARDAFVLQSDLWAVAYLPGRNMKTIDIAKTGDSDAKQILSEYTLEARNEAGSGGIYDLTTAAGGGGEEEEEEEEA